MGGGDGGVAAPVAVQKKAGGPNQCSACATTRRSALAASSVERSAGSQRYSMLERSSALWSWAADGSVASTRSKRDASSTAACPLPVAASHASAVAGACAASQSKSGPG